MAWAVLTHELIFLARRRIAASPVRPWRKTRRESLLIGTERRGLFQLRDGKISSMGRAGQRNFLPAGRHHDVVVGGATSVTVWRASKIVWKICSTAQRWPGSDSIGYLIDDSAGILWLGFV